MKTLPLRLCIAILVPWLASACATLRLDPFPEPIRPPKAPAASTTQEEYAPPSEEAPTGPRTSRAPGVVIQRTVAEGIADRLGADLEGDPIRVSFHEVPLVPFINEVFGEELGMSFVISPGLRDKSDLVTLKLTEPLPPRQLFATVRRVLGEYGIDIREVEEGILSFSPSQETAYARGASAREWPCPARGPRHPPHDLPVGAARGRAGAAGEGLAEAGIRAPGVSSFSRIRSETPCCSRAARITLARALAMIEVLDQPLMRGRHGLIIEPVFMEARRARGRPQFSAARRGVPVECWQPRGRRRCDPPRAR